MWVAEQSVDVAAPPAAVWAKYTDVANWPTWDSGLVEASLDGQFDTGGTGRMKTPKGPAARFTLTAVEPDRSFTEETRFPGVRMILEHEIAATDTGCRVTHRARLTGPLAFLWQRILGPRIERALPGAVAGVARAAEGGANPAPTAGT